MGRKVPFKQDRGNSKKSRAFEIQKSNVVASSEFKVKYGKDILKDYMKLEYGIELNNYDDTACMIFDINNQPVYSGGSGPACAPLVTYSYIFDLMKKKKLNKVLLIATGALLSQTSANEKRSIPSIAHAISLEVVK